MNTETRTLSDELSAILAPVADDLAEVDRVLSEILRPPSGRVRPILEHVERFGGKKLRPALTLLAGRCFGDIGRSHHQVGAIVELIHTATLVHDDVLDRADVRRGLPTINRDWGNHTAVLLGDYLFSTAFALSANLEDRLASRYLSFITGIVCQGEMLQILETGNLDLTEEAYLDVIEKKTAYLFSAAARVGAAYAGAPEAACEGLADYGMRLGTAFQIVDDCLDLDGVEENVGKTLGTDAMQGKATLPIIRFFGVAAEGDAARMRELLRSGDPGVRGEVRGLLEESGALEFARDRAIRYAEEAEKGLSAVPEGSAREALERLARYTLSRRR